MRLLHAIQMQLNWLLQRQRGEADLNDELQDYLERQTEKHRARGLSREDARLAALRDSGGLEQVKEQCRDTRKTAWLENIWQDLRYACRTLARAQGFTWATIGTLALGIGANTALFNVINGVVLRPLPYREPQQLVDVQEVNRQGGFWSFSYPDFLDCAHNAHSFETMAAWRNLGANLTSPGEPEYVPARMVSASFLSVLGINPIAGRNFSVDEDRPGGPPEAIISYSLWQQRFQGSPAAVGQRLILNGRAYTVIGVLPAGFRFLEERAVLTSIGQNNDGLLFQRDMHTGIQAIARLKPGVSLAEGLSDLHLVGDQLTKAYPASNANLTFTAIPLRQQVIGDADRMLFLLGGAVCLVLMIACVNVANLFLARSVSREREFALRAALGAQQRRLLCQLLTESLLLSLSGGVIGLLIAAAGTRWALAHLPQWLPPSRDIVLDWRVLLFSLIISVLSGIAFGVAPAFRGKLDLESVLRRGGKGSEKGVHHLQSAFVIAELALALILLAGAGLMLRTLSQLFSIDPGFDPHHLLTMQVGLRPDDAKSPQAIRTGWQQTLQRVTSTPGIEAASLDSVLPVNDESQNLHYWTTPEADVPKNASSAFLFTPTPGYLKTLKIPLLAGRFFDDRDRLGSPAVVVIDDLLARKTFGNGNAVGNVLSVQFLGKVRVVGVVGHIKHTSLDEDEASPPEPTLFLPLFQFPDAFMSLTSTGMNMLVRSSLPVDTAIQVVKKSILGPARDAPVRDVSTMEQVIGYSMSQRRGIAVLLGLFALIALGLAAIGIYSVISYGMNLRVQEIGIRMALGARSRQVLSLVFAQASRNIVIGIAIGMAAGVGLTRLLSKLLFRVSPVDPMTFALAVASICAIALIAVYIPARRSARTDPSIALRHE